MLNYFSNAPLGAGAGTDEAGLQLTQFLFDQPLFSRGEQARVDVAQAARALGEALAGALRAGGARGHGSAVLPADEALAHVALEVSDRPLLVTNVDLTSAHVGGAASDVVAEFLRELAEGAGITLHIRLISGDDAQHVLEAMFKALGVALSQARRTRPTREEE